jgi:hypothetical protein
MLLLGVSGIGTGLEIVLNTFVEMEWLLRKILMAVSVIKAICQLLYSDNIPLPI